ncbi:La-related protein 6, partial [Orchesella cincta]
LPFSSSRRANVSVRDIFPHVTTLAIELLHSAEKTQQVVPCEESSSTIMVDEDKARVELQEKIVVTIEDLFSDENLAKDDFLRGHIGRHKEGFVSLKLVVAYKRVKAVSKDLPLIQAALQGRSHKLQMNVLSTKIRRLEPLPPYLEKELEKEKKKKKKESKVEKSNSAALAPPENEDGGDSPTPPGKVEGSGVAPSPPKTSQWLQKRLDAKLKSPSKMTGPLGSAPPGKALKAENSKLSQNKQVLELQRIPSQDSISFFPSAANIGGGD